MVAFTHAILKDTKFNSHLRTHELNEYNFYLKNYALVGRELKVERFLSEYLIHPLDQYYRQHSEKGFWKPLLDFKLYTKGYGRFEINLVTKTPALSMIRQMFRTLTHTKHQLYDLRGCVLHHPGYGDAYYYVIDITCIEMKRPNGGLYNLALLTYAIQQHLNAQNEQE